MDVIEETGALLRSLRDVWDEEAVDELDHATQAAACALADGADDELVLAAALHDLAHSPLFGHPDTDDLGSPEPDTPDRQAHDRFARAWLRPRYGERVAWLAGAHVAAKRHLAQTDPAYAAALSATSVASLRAQGGAGSDDPRVTHPWWPDALRLRRYDDAAKVAGAPALTVDQVLDVARRVLTAR